MIYHTTTYSTRVRRIIFDKVFLYIVFYKRFWLLVRIRIRLGIRTVSTDTNPAPDPDASMKSKKIEKNIDFDGFCNLLSLNTDVQKAIEDKSRSLIHNPVYGSMDPDPYENVTDPEHRFSVTCPLLYLFFPLGCWQLRG